MSTTDDILAQAEARIRDPFAYIPPQYRAAVARYFLDYDPDEEFVGTSYEHGEAIMYLWLLIRALLQGRVYTLYQNTDFDIDVTSEIAGQYARRTRKRKISDAAGDGGTPPAPALVQTQPFAPDIAVVLDQPPPVGSQRSYRIGRDGRIPDIAIEVASNRTAHFDIDSKPHIHCYILQIPEYFAFDPRKGGHRPYWSGPQLRGWRRMDGNYVEIQPNPQGRLWSDALQSWLGPDDAHGQNELLCLWDINGNRRLTIEEAAEAARAVEIGRVAQERQAKEVAEAETARLREEIRRLKGEG